MDESLSFENINSTSLNAQNIGGPPMPVYRDCQPTINVNNLTDAQKHAAYMAYLNNSGYTPLDYTLLTSATADTSTILVNNTSFFIFFSMFLIITILVLLLMIYNHLDIVVGLHMIVLFAIIIYIASILYRNHTLSAIKMGKDSVDHSIERNRIAFENSIIQLPRHLSNLSQLTSIPSMTPSKPIHMMPVDVNESCDDTYSESECSFTDDDYTIDSNATSGTSTSVSFTSSNY